MKTCCALVEDVYKNTVMEQQALGSPAWCQAGLSEVKNKHPASAYLPSSSPPYRVTRYENTPVI